MTNTGGPAVPAAWYTDPGGSGHLRWWDGTAWTAHLAPQPAAVSVAPAPVAQAPAAQAPAAQPPAAQSLVVLPPVSFDEEPHDSFEDSLQRTSGPSAYSIARDIGFARPAQWNTAAAWLLAFSYPFVLIIAVVFVILALPTLENENAVQRESTIATASVVIEAVLWLLMVLLAFADRRKLRSYGYLHTASPWWSLLPSPLFYLIMRGVAVHREVRRGFGPMFTFIISVVLLSIVGAVTPYIATAVIATQDAATTSSSEFASSLQTGLDEKGGHFTVSCPPTIPTTLGADFTCTAVDSSGVKHAIKIQVVTGADGKPGVKLLSVTPAIKG